MTLKNRRSAFWGLLKDSWPSHRLNFRVREVRGTAWLCWTFFSVNTSTRHFSRTPRRLLRMTPISRKKMDPLPRKCDSSDQNMVTGLDFNNILFFSIHIVYVACGEFKITSLLLYWIHHSVGYEEILCVFNIQPLLTYFILSNKHQIGNWQLLGRQFARKW